MTVKILPNNIAIVEGDEWIGRWVQESNRLDHDQNALPYVLPLVKAGDTVVDAGANIGDWTCALLKAVGGTGTVLAFEPNPDSHACLVHNCPGVIPYNNGLSDETGPVILKREANAGASYLIQGTIGAQETWVITLDSFNLHRLDLFKLDVEGFELKALRGATSTIKRLRPVIVMEMNRGALARNGHTYDDIWAYLQEMGYTYANLYPGQPLDGEQFDIIAKPL